MKDELEYSFKKLKEATKKLEEGIKETKDQLDRDGVIQDLNFLLSCYGKL